MAPDFTCRLLLYPNLFIASPLRDARLSLNPCNFLFAFQPIDNDVWWYYMLSLSFYWSMTLRHFFDVKHKVRV